MFNRWMKEPYQEQGMMGGQDDPGPITDQDGSIMFKSKIKKPSISLVDYSFGGKLTFDFVRSQMNPLK